MAIRIPSAREYAQQPFEERTRLVTAMHKLLAEWAETERP